MDTYTSNNKIIREKTIVGIKWVFFFVLSVRIIEFFANIVLARILLPEDFGVFALATLVITSIAIIQDLGIRPALIHCNKDIQATSHTAFILTTGMGIFLYIFIFSTTEWVSTFFNNEILGRTVKILGLIVIQNSLYMVPLTLLDKELSFKKRSLPEVSQAIVFAIVSVVTAINGLGVWSLIYGRVASAAIYLFFIWMVTGWHPKFEFNLPILRELLRYGKHIIISNIVVYALFNLDTFIIGKYLGSSLLGFYSLAYRIANLPAINFTEHINQVLFPAFSKLQNDLNLLKNQLLSTLKYVSWIIVPMSIGLVFVASPFIRIVYGEKWSPAILPLQILAAYGVFRSFNGTMGEVFKALGKPEILKNVTLGQLMFILIFIYHATQLGGMIGICLLFSLSQAFAFFLIIINLRKVMSISMREILGSVKDSVMVAFVSIGSATIIARVLAGHEDWLFLASSVFLSVCIYGTAMCMSDRSILFKLKELVKTA